MDDVFGLMNKTACKEVLFFEEPLVSLKAVLVINNTTLGPALVRCDMHDYKNADDAVHEALDMAFFMTYSSALMKRNLGGGSLVLIGDPKKVKSEMYFRVLGNFINKLKGKVYLTNGSEISMNDLEDIKRESDFVLGLNKCSKGSGNTSPSIASGMVKGIKAIVKEVWDHTSLENMKISIQGVGNVGSYMVQELIKEKSKITITDIEYDKIKIVQDKYPSIKVVKPQEILKADSDIFINCSYINLINDQNIDQLKAKIVTGSVSRLTDTEELMEKLLKKGTVVVPGFVINSGEIIQLSNELDAFSTSKTKEDLKDIYYTTLSVLQKAKMQKKSIKDTALAMAKKYIDDITAVKALK